MARTEITFTAASDDITNSNAWTDITSELSKGEGAIGTSAAIGSQGIQLHVQSSNAAITGNLQLKWVYDDGTTKYVEAIAGGSFAAGAYRTSADNTSGNYVCTVTWNSVTHPLIDLCPFAEGPGPATNPVLRAYLGCTTLSGATTLTCQLYSTRYAC